LPGEIRGHEVSVARYHGAPHQDCDYLLNRLGEWLNSATFSPPTGLEMAYAFIKASMEKILTFLPLTAQPPKKE